MSDLIQQLGPLIATVQLEGIRVVESSCKALSHDLAEPAEIDLRLNWSARAVLRAAGSFSVLADMEVLLVPAGSSDPDGARIWARFELAYRVPQETEVNEGLLEEFAKLNGVFNAWPYWREYVQSTLTRMGLPPVALPLYRVQGTGRAAPAKSKPTTSRG